MEALNSLRADLKQVYMLRTILPVKMYSCFKTAKTTTFPVLYVIVLPAVNHYVVGDDDDDDKN